MKKFLYVLLGAASAVIVSSLFERRGESLRGALPRPLPEDFNGEVLSASDELRAPAPEV